MNREENPKIIALRKVCKEVNEEWNRYLRSQELPSIENPIVVLADNTKSEYIGVALKGHESLVHVFFKLKSNTVIPYGNFEININDDSFPHEIFGLAFLASILTTRVTKFKYAIRDYIRL